MSTETKLPSCRDEAAARDSRSSTNEAARVIVRNAAASTMGASVVALLVTPLDVAKVRMQAHVCPVGGSVPCVDPAHPSSTVDAMRKVVRVDGIRGLWRGLWPTLVLAVPTTGLYFTIYEALRNHLDFSPIQAGASARVIAATAASPLELARTALQAGTPGGMFSVLNRIRAGQGARALWRGLLPTLMRDVPFSSIYWCAYERLKDPKKSPLPAPLFNTPSVPLVAGICAGSAAAVFTIPADVVKTRRQASTAAGVPSHTVSAIVRDILRTDGVRGFLKGTAPRMAKIGPSCAIMMGSYELFRKWFGA